MHSGINKFLVAEPDGCQRAAGHLQRGGTPLMHHQRFGSEPRKLCSSSSPPASGARRDLQDLRDDRRHRRQPEGTPLVHLEVRRVLVHEERQDSRGYQRLHADPLQPVGPSQGRRDHLQRPLEALRRQPGQLFLRPTSGPAGEISARDPRRHRDLVQHGAGDLGQPVAGERPEGGRIVRRGRRQRGPDRLRAEGRHRQVRGRPRLHVAGSRTTHRDRVDRTPGHHQPRRHRRTCHFSGRVWIRPNRTS